MLSKKVKEQLASFITIEFETNKLVFKDYGSTTIIHEVLGITDILKKNGVKYNVFLDTHIELE